MNPVLREGNSDRRAPRAVKEYAQSHPHSMAAWSSNSKTRVATMGEHGFCSNARSVTMEHADDLRIAHGRLDVYAPRGSYSLIVDRIEGRGIGALLEQLEKLKAKLAEDGWFDRSRPLPRLPRMIGVVTSRDGAPFHPIRQGGRLGVQLAANGP